MSEKYPSRIATELKIPLRSVQSTVDLLDGGATVPFISRYRKEATGSLDEVAVTAIRDRIHQLRELDKRRDVILQSIQEQGKLTDDLKDKILAADTMAVLEDIYLPYRPKRRTRATIAKEKGLEPLAAMIFEQKILAPEKEALAFVDPEKKVETAEDALAGARDIIAEWINENAEARANIRALYFQKGMFQSRAIRGKEQEGANYRDYFEWQEAVSAAPSHRVLAARRGEKEEILSLRVVAPEDEALKILETQFVKSNNRASQQVRLAAFDGYKRLLSLSMETEIRVATKEKADLDAIKVFAQNLRQLLLAPPLGPKFVMAVDPGYRTGCKVVCLDPQGKLLNFSTVYPTESPGKIEESARVIKDLCSKFHVEVIAIGNGTACREAESFIRGIGLPKEIQVLIVNESGASIYSASEVARKEFPDQDVTVRGAISIGRRLMDPLAELVKIDPKSIGVGQYQHDVDQPMLKQSLDDVVVSCVNLVGVELNTASKELLTYVSGLGEARAQAIVEFRNQQGPFRSRSELAGVPRLGPKAIEQAAGFLRIRGAENPLDASAVHPESYDVVYAMAKSLNCTVKDLVQNDQLRRQIDLTKYITSVIGLPTLQDIVAELAKP
ncbi:MAG: Tex family protein, partial [Candidatus Omnitrophota bacterium]|nr:Tex family protein [Candidatus Omnitrophota bacterium]